MMTLRPILLLPLLLAACAHTDTTSGRYTGPAPQCGRSQGGGTVASLTRLGAGFALAPYDGSIIVHGHVVGDGTVSGELALRPADAKPASSGGKPPAAPSHAPQTISVGGILMPESARLSYAAPGCPAELLTLTRVHPPLL